MKRFIITALIGLGWFGSLRAAPQPDYHNTGQVTGPTNLDYVIFENSGQFAFTNSDISTNFGAGGGSVFRQVYIPYVTQDTLYFTNDSSGLIDITPGFRFDTETVSSIHSAASFNNSGTIIGEDIAATVLNLITSVNVVPSPEPSQISVLATNISNDGDISVGNNGLLQLTGSNIDLSNGSLAAGSVSEIDPHDVTGRETATNSFLFFGFPYVNPPGVYDLFWGVDTGLIFSVAQDPGLGGTYTVSFTNDFYPFSFITTRDGAANFNSLLNNQGNGFPSESFPGQSAFEYQSTNFLFNSNTFYYTINVVFVNTNLTDTNVSVKVAFNNTANTNGLFFLFNNGVEDVVQFSEAVPDVVTGQIVTNSIYLLDTGAEFGTNLIVTNAAYQDGFGRPSGFEITTTEPVEWTNAQPANVPFDPFLANGFFATFNDAIYRAQVGRNPEQLDGAFTETETNFATVPLVDVPDPTSEPGRLEIFGQKLNLSNSRLRAEGVASMTATNLTGAPLAKDWGNINSDLNETNGFQTITNIFPTTFHRVRGDITAWAGDGQFIVFGGGVSNIYTYHVLFVEPSLRGSFNSSVRNLTLRATNTVVEDNLRVINQSLFLSRNLTFNSVVNLTQSAGSLLPANIPNLKYFFNNTNAVLTVDNLIEIGYNASIGHTVPLNRKYTVATITNFGTITAISPLLQAQNFECDGTIIASNGGSMLIEAGALGLGLALTNSTNYLVADANVSLSAFAIGVTNSRIITGGTNGLGKGQLLLESSSGGEITDFVSAAPSTNSPLINFWQVTDGFSLPVKPATGDLFGTEITTMATNYTVALHTWAGEDRGGTNGAGFLNNVVIGHLKLSRQSEGAQLHFTGAGAKNAMYVDYLELDPNSLSFSDYRNGLIIDPNLTIYFADSNVDPEKLQDVYPKRLIWVTNFWGPNSTTMVTNKLNPNQACPVNAAVADSSGTNASFFPGLPNAYNQPYPLNDPNTGAWLYGTNGCPAISYAFASSSGPLFTNQTFGPIKGTYNGLFYDTNQVASTNSGFFTFTLSQNGAFSGRLLMGPTVYTFSSTAASKFNSSGATQVVAKHGRQSLIVNLQLVDEPGGTTDEVQGDVNGGTWDAQLRGDLKPAWTAKNPSPYLGQYTMILTNNGSNSVPGGDSYASLNVNKQGVLSVAGRLADGSAFSQSVPISKDGFWPLYAYVAGGGDFLLGWVAFQGSDFSVTTIGETNIFWSKTPLAAGPYYPAGFTNAFSLVGSPYTDPGRKASGLNLAAPFIMLNGGGLVESVTNSVAYNGKLMYSTNNLTLSINPALGTFTGRFRNADGSLSLKMNGVVLQDQNSAFGFFLGTDNESGAVLLQSQ